MKLNKHSNLASFYRYFYLTGDLPNNLCSYFWKLLIAFISTPIVLPALIINRVFNPITLRKSSWDGEKYYAISYNSVSTAAGIALNIVLMIIATLVTKLGIMIFKLDLREVISSNIFIGICQIFLIGYVTCFVVYFLIKLINFIVKNTPSIYTPKELEERRRIKEEKRLEKENKIKQNRKNPSFLELTWKTIVDFKNKNCALITWEDNNENNTNNE